MAPFASKKLDLEASRRRFRMLRQEDSSDISHYEPNWRGTCFRHLLHTIVYYVYRIPYTTLKGV